MRYITLKELENRKKFLKNRIEKLHAEYVTKALQEEDRRKKEEKEREKIAKKNKEIFYPHLHFERDFMHEETEHVRMLRHCISEIDFLIEFIKTKFGDKEGINNENS